MERLIHQGDTYYREKSFAKRNTGAAIRREMLSSALGDRKIRISEYQRSLSNLMLQRWDGEDGAKRKDLLEVKLPCPVCSGQVPLDEAREATFNNWQAAYQSYAQIKCHRNK